MKNLKPSSNISRKKLSFAAITLLAASTVVATTPFAASASCNSPISSVLDSGCEVPDQNFTVNKNGGISITSDGAALFTDTTFSNVLTNNGNLTFSNSDPEEDIDVYGIDLVDDVDGVVINNGSITLTSITSDDIDSYGILVRDVVSGSITNNGSIKITSNSETQEITAYGISTPELSGSITNNGTIELNMISQQDTVDGFGISASNISGSITNNGTIDLNLEAADTADGYGIYTSNISGSVINNGTIDLNIATEENSADGFGIRVLDVSGSVINNGTINLVADADDDTQVDAYGISAAEILGSGIVKNTGIISVTSSSDGDTVEARGINIFNGLQDNATLVNSGSLTVSSKANVYGNAYSYGINVGGSLSDPSTSITNNGTISVSAVSDGFTGSSNAAAVGYGVLVQGLMNGQIVNNGTINVITDNPETEADAYGIAVTSNTSHSGTIVNNGNITVDSSGDDTNSFGIYISGDNNNEIEVTNNGKVFATADETDSAYSLYINSSEGTIVTNNGIMYGSIRDNGTNSLINEGNIFLPSEANATMGTYNQSASGVLSIGVKSEDNYAQFSPVNSTFANNTKLRIVLEGGSTYAGQTLENVIDSTTLTNGNFIVNDNSLAYNFTAVVDGDDNIDLTATDTGLTTLAALFPNSGLATQLDKFMGGTDTPSLDLLPLLDVLGAADSADDVQGIVQQSSPLLAGGVEQAIIDAISNTGKVIEARQEGMSGLSSGDEAELGKAVWLRTFGSMATQDATDGTSGYDSDSFGVVLGGDKLVSEDVRLGIAAVYANTNVDVNSATAPQTNDINSYQGVLYGTYSLSELTDLNFQADIGLNKNEGTRNILAVPAVAQSEFDSWSHHIGTSIRHLITMNEATSFIPSASVDFTNISTDGYTETGAGGSNLNVSEDDQQSLVFGLDGKVEHKLSDTFAVNANLGAGYDVLADRSSITSSFVGGGGTFVTNGIDKDPLMVNAGAGVVISEFHGVEVSAKYDVEMRTSDYTNQTASIKLRMPF